MTHSPTPPHTTRSTIPSTFCTVRTTAHSTRIPCTRRSTDATRAQPTVEVFLPVPLAGGKIISHSRHHLRPHHQHQQLQQEVPQQLCVPPPLALYHRHHHYRHAISSSMRQPSNSHSSNITNQVPSLTALLRIYQQILYSIDGKHVLASTS